jgi:hypothetical protein
MQSTAAAAAADGDGKIGTSELKGLLAASGLTVLSNVAAMIPEVSTVAPHPPLCVISILLDV